MNKKDFDKIYVLDTNVLIHDAQSIYKFQNNLVIIPMTVLEEVDTFKKGQDEKSRNSRQFSRYLDKLRVTGNIAKGVELDNGGYLKIDLEDGIENGTNDNRILAVACKNKEDYKNKKVALISKDINMRIKANAKGIDSGDYESDKVKFEEMYSGVYVHDGDGELINDLYQNKELDIKNVEGLPELCPNQYVVIKCSYQKQKGICRYDSKSGMLVPLIQDRNRDMWGVSHRNLEQAIAIDMLLNDDIKLVSLVGKAGTGKTLLSIASGLYKSLEEPVYKKMLVARPIYPLGKDLGYLPGDIEEKLSPWMKPIMDNLEYLLGGQNGNSSKTTVRELFNNDFVAVEPLTYIRGRSIPNQFIVIDEAQNLTPHEIKTIISRAGENTKIVLTGDCYQIDNPYVDACSNGLSHVVECFKNEPIAGHITLLKGERSELADIASNVL